jgi:outer membrane receptor protein involved in Fe transport
MGRLYVYWAPHSWWAIRAEYRYEEIDRTDEFSEGIREAKTHIIPLGINFFHPSGISAGAKATYYDQEGEFIRKDTLTFDTGDDRFWIVDAILGYKLPRRYGVVTLGVNNLFDKNFDFADTDIANPRIQLGRTFFAKVSISFP